MPLNLMNISIYDQNTIIELWSWPYRLILSKGTPFYNQDIVLYYTPLSSEYTTHKLLHNTHYRKVSACKHTSMKYESTS